jgi:hypothetical protein
MCAPHRVKLPQTLGTMLSELVKYVGILHIATNTISDRRLPTTLEQITIIEIIKTVYALGHERASMSGFLFTNRQLGITLTNTLYHHKRRIVKSKVVSSIIIVDLLVHATDEIRQRHITLQSVNHVGLVHREKNYDRVL